MSYKIKHKKKEIPASYWKQEEIARIRKKYKGKIPPFLVLTREGSRIVVGIPRRLHRKGEWVYYKDKIGIVKSVSKEGVWIKMFSKDGIATPVRKEVFVSEKKLDEGKVYPVFTNIPVGTNLEIQFK